MYEEIIETQIQVKEKELREIIKKYQAASTQKLSTLSAVDRVTIDLTMQVLESEMQETGLELQNLRLSSQEKNITYRQTSRRWEDELHKINFSKVESTIKPIFNDLKHNSGSALFLLRRSRYMGGKWCIQKIKRKINDELGTLVLSYEIGFFSFQQLDPFGFLSQLAVRLSIQINEEMDLESARNKIVDRMVDSLVTGTILILDVNIYSLARDDRFLVWFVSDFWVELVRRNHLLSQKKHRIRLIAMLSIRDSVPSNCLPDSICCKKSKFDGNKILPLPLQKWTEAEIRNWLFDFSGLTSSSAQLTDAQIVEMARNIHQVGQGSPDNIYHELMESLNQCAC